MRKKLSLGLALLITLASQNISKAEDHQTYALDKLANAQAQLDRLRAQKKAIDELIKAVKKDLRAAKIRAKAERIQLQADTNRQDAAVMVEQTGVAIDLPDLMNTRSLEGNIVEYKPDEKDIDLMFKDKEQPKKSVYFPGGDKGKKIKPDSGINNDSDMPDYIK